MRFWDAVASAGPTNNVKALEAKQLQISVTISQVRLHRHHRSVNFFLTTCTSAEQCDYRYTRTAGQTDGKHIAHMTADADITMAKLYSTTPNHKLHIHPFNGLLSMTTRVSRYQKGKTNLDFTEARDSEWQWHQLGHMQVCTSLLTDNHASTPPLSFYRPDALPAAQPTASKH